MNICITTYVFGTYQRFVPYYIYSILKSYPQYHVKLFIDNYVSKPNKLALNYIRENLSSNFDIIENYHYLIKSNNQLKKSLRWLIPYKDLSCYDTAYIGDVDFLIIKEEPSILEYHLEHCNITNLPYSNAIRPNSKRLTGLHFIKVKDYYDKIGSVIDNYLANYKKLIYDVSKFSRNEEFLYALMKNNIGLPIQNVTFYTPHHGFHLGLLRGSKSIVPEDYEFKHKVMHYFSDHMFNKLIEIAPCNEILLFKNKFVK